MHHLHVQASTVTPSTYYNIRWQNNSAVCISRATPIVQMKCRCSLFTYACLHSCWLLSMQSIFKTCSFLYLCNYYYYHSLFAGNGIVVIERLAGTLGSTLLCRTCIPDHSAPTARRPRQLMNAEILCMQSGLTNSSYCNAMCLHSLCSWLIIVHNKNAIQLFLIVLLSAWNIQVSSTM